MSIKAKLWLQSLVPLLCIIIFTALSMVWINLSQHKQLIEENLSSTLQLLYTEIVELQEETQKKLTKRAKNDRVSSLIKSYFLLPEHLTDLKTTLQCELSSLLQSYVKHDEFDTFAAYTPQHLIGYATPTRFNITGQAANGDRVNMEPTAISVLLQCDEKSWSPSNDEENIPLNIKIPSQTEVKIVDLGQEIYIQAIIPIKSPVFGTSTQQNRIYGALLARKKVTREFLKHYSEKTLSNVDILFSGGKASVSNAAKLPKVLQDLSLKATQAGEVFSSVRINKEDLYVLVKPLAGHQKEEFHIVAYSSKDITRNNTKKVIYSQATALFFAVLVVSLITIYFSRFIIRPLTEITQQMNKISTEKCFNRRVSVNSKDEVGGLAISFNRMISEVNQYILELGKSRRQLEESEKKYRGIFENSTAGIFRLGPDYKLLTVNPALAEMLGYQSPTLMLEKVDDIRDNLFFNSEMVVNLFTELKKFGVVKGIELSCYQSSRAIIAVLINANAIKNKQGDIMYIEGSLENVTFQKRAEELKIEKEAAELNAKTKSDFLANMSHEIRTPMNAIIGLTDLALQGVLAPKQKDYLEKVSFSAHSLLGIINDILDFSKIEAGKLELENIPFDLVEQLNYVRNLLDVKAKEKGLTLSVSIAQNLSKSFIGDPLRLNQILINLGNNAVKFSSEGEIKIFVSPLSTFKKEEQVFTKLKFTVKDSGIGMSKDQMKKLFRSFSQADTSTTRTYGGTGLGLAISKQLTQMMKGDIWAESIEGEGSSFYFTLELETPNERPCDASVKSPVNNVKTLIVASSADSLQHIKRLAGKCSKSITAYSSIEDLKQQYLENKLNEHYGLILLSLDKMERLTAREIKELKVICSGSEKGAVFVITADPNALSQERLGVDHILNFSVTPSEFFEIFLLSFHSELNESYSTFPTPENIKHKLNSISGAQILLVEDNTLNQQVAVEILTNNGFYVKIAENGQKAIKMAKEGAYDLILMDIQMPIMDGYEATRQIRQTESIKHIPIIAMTAHALKSEKARCFEVGMNDFASKPIDPDKLFYKLTKWIKPTNRKVNIQTPSSIASYPDVLDRLKKIEGLDLSKGLFRTGGDPTFLKDLLLGFYRKNINLTSDLQLFMSEKNGVAVKQAIHTLKGVSANLGLTAIQAECIKIEAGVEVPVAWDGVDINPLLKNVASALKGIRAFDAIALLPQTINIEKEKSLCIEELSKQMNKVISLMENDFSQTTEVMRSLKTMTTETSWYEKVALLDIYVNDFDVENANKLVNSITNNEWLSS